MVGRGGWWVMTLLVGAVWSGAALAADDGLWGLGQKLLKSYGQGSQQTSAATLTDTDIGAGLKDALHVAAGKVVDQLGRRDGFNADPAVHLPLPDSLKRVQSTLSRLGMSGSLDDLELRLNRAAEMAVGDTRDLFWNAIRQMTLKDVRAIYNGPDDAATLYFRDKMSAPLAARMGPVVERSLNAAGAVQAYDRVMAKYESLPFVPDAKADLKDYVVRKGLDGVFHYMAVQEAAIRHDPAARTTALLRQVFGAR